MVCHHICHGVCLSSIGSGCGVSGRSVDNWVAKVTGTFPSAGHLSTKVPRTRECGVHWRIS